MIKSIDVEYVNISIYIPLSASSYIKLPVKLRKTRADKNMVNDLDYEDIECPVSKKECNKIEQKNNFCINVFSYENNLIYPVYVSDEKI